MIELTANQKARIETDKINRALYRLNAKCGMGGANFERLKYNADELAAALSDVKSIAKAAASLEGIIEEISLKAAEIDRARAAREGKKPLRGEKTAQWLQTRTDSRFSDD